MKSLRRLPALLYPYRFHVALAVLLLILMTVARLAVPVIIQQVIDVGLVAGEIRTLLNFGLLIVTIGAARAVITFWQRYLSEWISNHVSYDLRNQLYDHIQRQTFTYHDQTQTGQLISRCIEDVRSLRQFTGFGIIELIRTVLLFSGVLILMFLSDPRLAAISMIPMVPLFLITSRFGTRISRLFLAVDQVLGELSSRLQENVLGVQVVRAFAREDFEIERFNQSNRDLYDARVNVISAWSKIMPTTRLLVGVSTVLILWFGGQMVIEGSMTVGALVAFNGYLLMLAQPAQQLAWVVNLAGEGAAGLERIYQILDQPSAIQTPADAAGMPKLSGQVSFEAVSVRYEGEENYALQEIDLTVEPNQIIALIGATGSGKSTLVNLIPRFYDVTSGKVSVDGHDVRNAELVSLRRQIGIVPQTSLLFSIPLWENIAFGRADATREEVINAAKAAQAHDFIEELPEGYETIVGERGVTLSGGQRQRIAIARALLLNPRILILDDSTSSVDTETERQIQTALNNLMVGRTTFIIAQRLSSVRKADRIIVLDHGHIVEQGRHADLLKLGGLYREIYELQLKSQEDPIQAHPQG